MEPNLLLIILGTICLCALLANRLSMAAPIAFLLGGILLALVPNMPAVHLNPEYMLVIFLPPILMEAAFFTSIRDFRANLRPILFLAIGLVIATTVAIAAVVVAFVPGATWALGFVLGAIISPPDAAAATSSLKNVRLPRRIIAILEGESLINDATGIVLYKFAVAAVLAGSFSFVDASSLFVWKSIGGIAIGLSIAYLFIRMYPYLRDPSVEILTTFLPPYAAYMLAESIDTSGVLAVVSAGLMIGWYAPSLFRPRMRIPAAAIWKMVVFFLNALAFLLIGLQLPQLVKNLDLVNNPSLIGSALAVCVASVVVRFIWVFAIAYGTRFLFPSIRVRDPYPHWRNIVVLGWTGMRGVVTLALALALPVTLSNGETFPQRDLIIFFATSVILFTLVLQGLTLPWLTRRLSFSFDAKRMQEEWSARVHGARRALARLDELVADQSVHKPALARIREHYTERLESLGDGPNTPLNSDRAPSLMSHPLLQAENRLWAEVLREERNTLLSMRRNYTIGDDVMHDMLQEMDLLATRFHYEAEELTQPLASPSEKVRLKQCAKHLRDKVTGAAVAEEPQTATAFIQ